MIGMGAILLNGVRVGKGSVVGAGAVLVEGMEVPPGSMVLGVPGRVVRAVDDADAVFSVPGIDAIFVGPNDLAASMRGKDGRPPGGELSAQTHKRILQACQRNKVPAGFHCTSADEVLQRIEEGWQFLAVGSELRMVLDGVNAVMQKLGGTRVKSEIAKY